MCSVSPVIRAESEEARKTAACAISSGCPMRSNGVCASTYFWKSLLIAPEACVPSVSTKPGLMALTRILREPSSLNDLVMAYDLCSFGNICLECDSEARALQICAIPPSTNSSMPLTKLLSSEARKTTALAISSGVPTLPSGIVLAWLSTNSCNCSSLSPK